MNTGPTPEDRKIVNDEIRMLYTSAVSEIAGFKQQQWHITNYGALLYVGLVSISRLFAYSATSRDKYLLSAIAFMVCIAGWVLVRMFKKSIHIRRERLTYMRKHLLSESFRAAWRAGKTSNEMPDLPEEKVQLEIFFRLLFAAGFAATLWIVWR